VLTMLALYLGRRRFTSQQTCQELIDGLCAIPDQMQKVLEQSEQIKKIALQFYERENWLFLGRGYHYPVALEGALKLKEISYIHAEGMPAAEMKHGPIALINDGMPVVFIATQGIQYDKVISNIEEVRARGGKIIAVDIAQNFLDHIARTCREAKLTNVETVKCTATSSELPANSVDVVFICDTYHHFEYPLRTMTSIHKALKPGGRVVVVDFHRIPGKSSEWILGHVRAAQEVVEKEIEDAGFKKVDENKKLLKENYLIIFEKVNDPRK
jgi:SAM-dependent methyltransferase